MLVDVRAVLLVMLLAFSSAGATEGYYQSPSLSSNTVVFTAEGDLWRYSLGSEPADRLTTHLSLETSASISPDGSQIAFVSDYEGVDEVYVMPISGGVPKRLTYKNSGTILQGWVSDEEILYNTISRVGPPVSLTLNTVNVDDLTVASIPLSDAHDAVIDPTGEYVYFTQYGLHWYGDNAHIYRGGMSGKLWRYRLGSDDEASRMISDHVGDIRRPMLHGDRLYFVSDASGRDNIWSVDLDGTDATQLTHHDDFSIRDVSIDGSRVVYQLGADLQMLDLLSLESERLNIQLTSDHPGLREKWVTDPLKFVTAARFAGDGEKVTVTARGKIATATVDQKRLVSIATPHRSRMRNAALSRDGKWVYAVSDASGELELWRFDATGAPTSERLAKGGNTFDASFFESPDGKWIAHDDGVGGLWLLNTETKSNQQIVADSETGFQFTDVQWSPDSGRLAFAHQGREDARPRILLYDLGEAKQAYLSSDKYESGWPAFTHDSKWLYYLSSRHFESKGNSVWQDRDFGPSFDGRAEVFAHALTKDAKFPFSVPTELSSSSTGAPVSPGS